VFEKIVIRNSESETGISPGDLAEAMLFYGKVHLVLDIWSLKTLINGIGIEELFALIRRKQITAYYAEDMLMVQNEQIDSRQLHSFISGAIAGKGGETQAKPIGRKERLAVTLEINGIAPRRARKFADEFLRHSHMGRLSDDHFLKGGIPNAAVSDLSRPDYVHAVMKTVLKNTVGFAGYADSLKVAIVPAPRNLSTHSGIRAEHKFWLQTNIDFDKANALRKAIDPTLEPINAGGLLSGILTARADIALAGFYGGDFRTSAMVSEIIRIQYSELLRRSRINADEISQFHNVALESYPTVREVVNSKQRSFAEFLSLLEKSQKFREMVRNLEPDEKLVTEYIAELSKEEWLSSIPAKAARYVITKIIGLGLGDVASVGAEIFDTFIAEKILPSWRPNHFVDRKLKPFLDT